MALGGAMFAGNSKLFEGPLGVIKVAFDGYDLGKTTEDAALVPDQDIKDITFSPCPGFIGVFNDFGLPAV